VKVQQETRKEESNLKPENLTDLPVAEEQAAETKGGTVVPDYALLECRFRDSTAK
jgi:hypothetical protein